MTDITIYDPIPESIPAPLNSRNNLLVIATGLVSAGVFIGYMALMGHYLAERAAALGAGQQWLPDGVTIPLTQPNYMGLTIAFSVITAWWAYASVKNNDNSNAYLAYGLTLVFGVAYIVQTFYLLSLMELVAAAGEREILLYSLIGLHLAIVAAAMVFMVVVGLRTMSGDYSSISYEGVLSSAIFWTVASVLYSVLWYAVYITK